jgi:transcriptional regulator with XRE-family HTH domain
MKFAVMLDMTEGSIANVENCKDESVKLSYERMLMILIATQLPKGWFFYDSNEDMLYLLDEQEEIFTRGEGEATYQEARDIVEITERIK